MCACVHICVSVCLSVCLSCLVSVSALILLCNSQLPVCDEFLYAGVGLGLGLGGYFGGLM